MIIVPTYTFKDSLPYVVYFIHMGKECIRVKGSIPFKSKINRDSDYYIKHKMFVRNYERTVK